MDYHGIQFLTASQFGSRIRSLKMRPLGFGELEFYERHCLLLPVARTIQPADYVLATNRRIYGIDRGDPYEVQPPLEWRRLSERDPDGIHPFDREMGSNPFLDQPTCGAYEPWGQDSVQLAWPDGRVITLPLVERYYSYWQVHVVHVLRRNKFYEHHRFLKELPEDHHLRQWYGIPEQTEWARELRGMRAGYQALARFEDRTSLGIDTIDRHHEDVDQAEATEAEFRRATEARARRSLELSECDETDFFEFVIKLVDLTYDYRRDERMALSEDVERDIGVAQTLAYFAYGHDWTGFVAAVEKQGGKYAADRLRRLDPVDSAAVDATRSIGYVLNSSFAVALGPEDIQNIPHRLIDFCLAHELFEVLTALRGYSFSIDDVRRDRFPGFLYRRLRPLALAVEQLSRGLLEASDSPHQRHRLPDLLRMIGATAEWLPEFNRQMSRGMTSDGDDSIEEKILQLEIGTADDNPHEIRAAHTLLIAVAARNLVSHRHRPVSRRVVEIAAGACARALIVVWLCGRERRRV